MNDPQKFLWPFLYAREVQQELEEKRVEVEKDFALRQSILGWVLDNPWIFFLLLRRETQRLESGSQQTDKAEIDRLTKENESLKKELAALKTGISQIYHAVADNLSLVMHQITNDEAFKNSPGMNKVSESDINTMLDEFIGRALVYLNELFVVTGTAQHAELVPRITQLHAEDEAKMNKFTSQYFANPDDELQKIIGIGPVISRALHENNVTTLKDLAAHTPDSLNELLAKGGVSAPTEYMMTPADWLEQAKFLTDESITAEERQANWEKWKSDKINAAAPKT